MTLVNDVVGQIRMPVSITRQTMEDILTTAFEGGIRYWCDDAVYLKGDRAECGEVGFYAPQGFEIHLHDSEDGRPFEDSHGLPYRHITEESLLDGIQRWAEWKEKHGHDVDFEDIDANDADLILQFSAFKEIVFG